MYWNCTNNLEHVTFILATGLDLSFKFAYLHIAIQNLLAFMVLQLNDNYTQGSRCLKFTFTSISYYLDAKYRTVGFPNTVIALSPGKERDFKGKKKKKQHAQHMLTRPMTE